MNGIIRSTAWLGFFAAILAAWSMMYTMSVDMDLDLLGRPGEMGARMAAMDPRMPMYMPMANFGPLFVMWAGMMAAMMLPTLIPTLRAYEDLMVSATGTRGGWVGVLVGYFVIWVVFAAAITSVQLALLFGGVIDMLGIAKSSLFAGGLLVAVGMFQFTRAKEICHGVCHSPMMYFLGNWRSGAVGGLRMGLGLAAKTHRTSSRNNTQPKHPPEKNQAWMGLATLFMIIEKLPQIGHYVTKPMGVIRVFAGFAVMALPLIMGG